MYNGCIMDTGRSVSRLLSIAHRRHRASRHVVATSSRYLGGDGYPRPILSLAPSLHHADGRRCRGTPRRPVCCLRDVLVMSNDIEQVLPSTRPGRTRFRILPGPPQSAWATLYGRPCAVGTTSLSCLVNRIDATLISTHGDDVPRIGYPHRTPRVMGCRGGSRRRTRCATGARAGHIIIYILHIILYYFWLRQVPNPMRNWDESGPYNKL